MTDRLEAIIANALSETSAPSNKLKAEWIAQRIRQALREEPVEAFGLRRSVGDEQDDGPNLYAVPQEEGQP